MGVAAGAMGAGIPGWAGAAEAGPVGPGAVSPRKKIPPGRYRVFVQAWSSNANTNLFDVDLGLYTDECRPGITSPSAGP